MPPTSQGSISKVRTYAEDLRRAQGAALPTQGKTQENALPAPTPIVTTKEDQHAGVPRQETLRTQPAVLQSAIRDAHTLTDTPKNEAAYFDIRHEEQHGGNEATIITDKRVRGWTFLNDISRAVKGWWQYLLAVADGPVDPTPTNTPTVDKVGENETRPTEPQMVQAPPRVAPQPPIPMQRSGQVPLVIVMPHPGKINEAPTTPGADGVAPKKTSGAWDRINEPRADEKTTNAAAFTETDSFKAALQNAIAKRPEPAIPAPSLKAARPVRTVPQQQQITPAPVSTSVTTQQPTPRAPEIEMPPTPTKPMRPQELKKPEDIVVPIPSFPPSAIDARDKAARARLEALKPIAEATPPEPTTPSEPLLPPRSVPFERPPLTGTTSAPIRTYRVDALSDIKEHQMSAPEIATQEMIRRGRSGVPIIVAEGPSRLIPILAIIVVLLAIGTVGTAAYLKFGNTGKVEEPMIVDKAPALFRVAHQLSFVVPQDRIGLLNAVNSLRLGTTLKTGEFAHFYGTYTDHTGEHTATTAYLLSVLDPRIGGSFERSLGSTMMMGAWSEGQSAYLVFTTDQFDTAFAGMLAWEEFMSADLAPFFGGPVRETYDQDARTANKTREAHFTDELYQNLDVRALYDEFGEMRIVYAFPDAGHIVIATSLDALGAIVAELRQ